MVKKELRSLKELTRIRCKHVLIAFLIFCCFLLSNIFNLAVINHQYYVDKTYDQITTESSLRARRGEIYDSNLNLLATSKTEWRVFVITKEIKAHTKNDKKDYIDIISKGLSDILNIDKEDLYNRISSAKVLDVTLKKGLTEDEHALVINFIKENGLEDMVLTESSSTRYYPNSTLAAHLLGFTGSDNQGLYGLEYQYNSYLAGKDGYYLYAKDANGNSMPGDYSVAVPREDGRSLVTTLDTYVQEELEAIIEQIRVTHSVTNRVCGVVMDTKTGAILAMATSTPFDPNAPFTLDEVSAQALDSSGYNITDTEYSKLKNELLQKMWSNKAVSETYEPGSTFKIITVASALDSGSAKVSDTFNCNGFHSVSGWRIKCHKVTGHGSGFDLSYGLQMSCNPTMMTIAERMGSEAFYNYIKNFGYLEKSNIDLPGEATTIFHEPNAIGPTELATTSFGQRFKVSIINHLRAIASVANGGILVEPYVVDQIMDTSGATIYKHETKEIRRVISEDIATTVADILEKGVSGNGGAKNAYVEGYAVAAKTGTSEKFDILDSNGNSYLRIGSTVAFAPATERGIAAIIVVDEPQSTVKYGSVVAAPYISMLFDKILPYLEYESATKTDDYTINSFIGMNANSAKTILSNDGIMYEIVGNGSVITDQNPKQGNIISRSMSKIYLYTNQKATETVKVPDLYGMTVTEANIILKSMGLNLKISLGVFSEDHNLLISSQSIHPGCKVALGTEVSVVAIYYDHED